jgi:hypothetical protein
MSDVTRILSALEHGDPRAAAMGPSLLMQAGAGSGE